MKIVNLSGTTEFVRQAIKLPGWYTIGIFDPLRRFLQDTYGVDQNLLNYDAMNKSNKYFKSPLGIVLKNLAQRADHDSFEMTTQMHALETAKKIIEAYEDPDAQSYPSYFWNKGLFWDHLWLQQDKGIFIVDDVIDATLLEKYNAKKLYLFKPYVQFKLKRQSEFIVYTDEINPDELQAKLDSI